LITGLLFREFKNYNFISFSSFYARRLKRLLPALILMVIIASISGLLLLSKLEARTQLTSAPFAATWTSNLYFSFANFDYFDELSSRDLFLHTWSLGVEEQFYLIWPAILLFLLRFKINLADSKTQRYSLTLVGLGIVLLLSLICSLYWTTESAQFAFYLMPSRIWQLSLGGIVYITFENFNWHEKYKEGFFFEILISIGLVLIVGSSILLDRNVVYPGFLAIPPSLGAAMVISSSYFLKIRKRSPLTHPVLVWIGDRSYSLYLWHWPILVLGFSLGFQDSLSKASLLLLSLMAATLSFQAIELPFWRGKWSHATPRHMILVSILLMLSVALGLYQTWRHLPQNDTTTDISNQWRMDLPIIYQMPCDAWYEHSRVEPCVFGVESASKSVVFIGDSIGAQWFSFIPALFPEPDWRTIVLTKSSCAIVDEEWFYQRIGKIYQVCTEWRNAVLDSLDKTRPDVLIIGNSATYGFNETQWIEGTSRILERVSKAAKKVLIIPGTPSLSFDGPGCVARNLSEGQINSNACLAKDRLKEVSTVTDYLDRAAQRFPNVYLLDLNDLVCPMGNCPAITSEGVVVFRDSQHLTDSFVKSRTPLIRKKLERLSTE
jgi:peptidoglycan/LPS O-acetylase OafA/YrhL